MSTPPPLPHASAQGWWDRNWKWCAVVLTLAGVGVLGAFVFGVFSVMRSSDAYQGALARVKAAPAVAAALGTPVKDGFLFRGTIQTNRDSGRAELAIPVSGPKGTATAHVFATKASGAWRYVQLLVHVEGTKENIDLSDREIPWKTPGSAATAIKPPVQDVAGPERSGEK